MADGACPERETPEESVARVLIVDDHSDLRELLATLLVDAGDFRVVGEAGDGLTAITVAGQCLPDLIILDLSMPRMDGLEALPLLKQTTPGAKVLVVSSFGVDAVVHAALEAGADGYICKGRDLVATFVPAARSLVAGGASSSDEGPAQLRTGER